MTVVKLKINGQDIEGRTGQTILEVVREQNLDDIPSLCHAEDLEPYGSCFVCVVEVKGRPTLVPSCATRIAEGMEVTTNSERIRASRRTALELLLSNHYADCVSPCSLACPAGVDCQGYLALAAMGLYQQAVDLIREANPLPSACGRVCVRKCELECRRNDVDQPVNINAVKRFVSDLPGAYDQPPVREADRGQTVGIIGSGPAGLTAAWFLGRKGYRPVMYEAMPRGGGMLRYGIPAYRLPDDVLDKEIDYICQAGAELKTGVRVGRDVSLAELRERHAALFLAPGAWAGKPMRVDGEHTTPGVVMGVDFLREKAEDPTPVEGIVTVVGGGNTAIDVARTAWRLGADKVIILYRRTKAEMPADSVEIEDALEEGIEIMELAAPAELILRDGALAGVRCIRMRLGEPDASGRRRPIPMEDSDFEVACRMVVSAIGQAPVLDGLLQTEGNELALTDWKTLKVDTATMQTSIEGVFAGGDAVDDGPTVVIDAVRDGRRAADAIHAHLSGEPIPKHPFVVTKAFWARPEPADLGDVRESPRHEARNIDIDERAGRFVEVSAGFETQDKNHECVRCLSCGCVKYDECDLRRYAGQYDVDMERFKGHVRKHKVDERHPYIVYDPNKCILCARCIRTCARVLPQSALGLVGRGFRTEMRPAMNDPLAETHCVSCGNCVDQCPTGALTVKYAFPGRASLATRDAKSYCAFCSLGCEISIRGFGTDRFYVEPSGKAGDYLCRYGRFGPELFVTHKRLVHAYLREDGQRHQAGLDDACARIVDALRETARTHGPDAVAVLVAPDLTNEELYLAARMAREGLGTNQIGSLSALESGYIPGRLDAQLGYTASTADRSALQEADLIICNNTNLEADQLVLSADVLRAVRGGAGLLMVNSAPDDGEQSLADIILDPMRGRAGHLWKGLLKLLYEGGAWDKTQVAALPGASALFDGTPADIQRILEQTGVDKKDLLAAVERIGAARRVVIVHGIDRANDRAAGDLEMLANLLIILRATGRDADLLLPAAQSNLMGMDLMGAHPLWAIGGQPTGEVGGAATVEAFRQALKDGRIRAALIIGEDPLSQDATAACFRNTEFLAVMDWTETETVRLADAALPMPTLLETPGTRCSFEGRVITFPAGVDSPAPAAGWQVLADMARRLGMPVTDGGLDALSGDIAAKITDGMGERRPFYWNTGEPRPRTNNVRLVDAEVSGPATPQPAPLREIERYKWDIRNIGKERFRTT
ncbi:MAG: hypothetical protein EOM20_12045 [Spartobacteria bacterium]|nr:hypothetical protein [Spartobacteria bacterium]